MRVVPAIAALLVLSACNNPCQRLCLRMKTFAEDCGYTVPDAELDACIDEQSSAIRDDKRTCRDFGDIGSIEQRWDCDDVAAYWGAGATTSSR